jgi:hypothetical protein
LGNVFEVCCGDDVVAFFKETYGETQFVRSICYYAYDPARGLQSLADELFAGSAAILISAPNYYLQATLGLNETDCGKKN